MENFKKYGECSNDGMMIRLVAPMEIFAAKSNALISRAAARDLFDWGDLIAENLFEDERDMFCKCFVFYTAISAETVNRNFDTSAIISYGKYEKAGNHCTKGSGRSRKCLLA